MEPDQDAYASATRCDRIFQQFFGLFLKRFHHSRRNFKGLISQIFLPAVFVCIAMTVAMSQPGYEVQPQLILSPTMIRPLPNVIPFNNEGNSNISKRMEKSLRFPSGIGADCVLRFTNNSITDINQFSRHQSDILNMYDGLCAKQLSTFMKFKPFKAQRTGKIEGASDRKRENTNKRCRCSKDKRRYICDHGIEGRYEEIATVTGEKLINITGRDMEQYLLYTTQHYQRHRY